MLLLPFLSRANSCALRLALTALALACGAPHLAAQAASASPASGTTLRTSTDPVIELSPFVVSTETESGYQATETLAGMRIKTNLKDVGAAIDVLTESFLNDVGAVDMFDALKYVANMEYAAFPSTNDAFNNSQWFSTSYVSRGIVGSTVLTDYFPTGAVPIDRYNTDNLTMMRGPNAILFGIGSPSGVVGSSSKRAQLNKGSYGVKFMVDSNDSLRGEFDVNRVLIPNRLAFRLAGVRQDRHVKQTPSLNQRNALFGTATYRPWNRTKLTLSLERGSWDRLHVQNSVVSDAYTPWVLAGKPMVSGKVGTFSTAIGSGLQTLSTGTYLVYVEGANAPIQDWRNTARGAQWSNSVPTGNPGSGLMLTADRASMSNIGFNEGNAIIDLNANWWGRTNTNDLDYHVESVFLEQNLARDLDLELAWNRHTSDYLFNSFGMNNSIFVDPNLFLPDGTPNPNAGLPYIETGNGGNGTRLTGEWRRFEHARATLSYQLDLEQHKVFRNFGLGTYRFAGLYQDGEFKQKLLSTRIVNVSPLPGNATATPLNQNQNRLSRRTYLRPGQSTFVYDGVPLFTQAAVRGNTPATTGPLNFEERMSDESPRNNVQGTESWVAAVQGSWWQSKEGWPRVTGLYGFRRDTQSSRSQAYTRNAAGEYAIPVTSLSHRSYEGLEAAGVWGPTTKVAADTKSYNVTLRPFGPVRVFYNYSDIFRASAANFTDVFGNPLRAAFGETRDYGVKLDLFTDRFYLTATRYETAVVDSTFDNSGTVREPINQIYDALARPELQLIRPFTYRDDTTTGYEYGLTANLTKGWNTRVTVGTQKTIVSAAFNDWVDYFAVNVPVWQRSATTPLVNPSAGYSTVADAIARANQRLIDARSIIGQQPTDQRSINSSLNTSYAFSSGPLKAVRIGGGYRWASKNILGYARDAAGNLDRNKPFKGEAQIATDASLGYSRRFRDGKLTWEVQLNVYNVLNDKKPLPRQSVDDGRGNPVVVRTYLPEPISFQLTNSLRF